MRKLLGITGLAILLFSCGGGGGGGSSVSSKTTYTGAASQGDLATFTFDGKNLSYSVSGVVFGNRTGTIQLSPVEGTQNFVYKDSEGNYFYFAGNLGVAEIPLDNGTAWVVGLKEVKTPSVDKLAGNSGKSYLYIEISANGSIEGHVLTVKPGKTWTLDDGSNGTWEIKDNYIVAKDSGGNTVANVMVKPGNSRAGIIVDLADGSGFGIGLEQRALNATEVTGTYEAYYYDPAHDIECFGSVTVNGTSYNYTESWCSDGNPESETGNLTLNQLCNGTPLNGIACSNDGYEIFVDPVDGYFIAVNLDTGERILGAK